MDKISEWVQAKLKQGFSEQEIRKALVDEGLDPGSVGLALGRKPVKPKPKKSKALLIAVCLFCIGLLSFFAFVFFIHGSPNIQRTPRYNGSIYFRDESLGFVFSQSAYSLSFLSNKSNDLVVSKVFMMDMNYTHAIFLTEEQLKKSYSSLKLLDSGEMPYFGRDSKILIYLIQEGKAKRVIRNAFFDYGEYTLFASLRCNQADDELCIGIFSRILESVYAE
ncbi:MAG TPA: hypothetical protein ENN46_01105 [Candidatus Woesearchaeota archaeon]|nr:hypothetical protein [Candidatus Woesearchaeota archaeon]